MTFVSVFGNFSTKAPRSGQIELAPFNQIAQKIERRAPQKLTESDRKKRHRRDNKILVCEAARPISYKIRRMFLRLTIHFMAITFLERQIERKTRESTTRKRLFTAKLDFVTTRFSKSFLIQSWQIWAGSMCVYGPLTLYNYASLFGLSGPRTTLENYWTPRQWHGIVREKRRTHRRPPRDLSRR